MSKQYKCSKVPPIYLKRLVEQEGTAKKVSKLLGMTDTAVSTMLQDPGGVRAVNEIAAKAIYNEKYGMKSLVNQQLALIQHNREGLLFIEQMLNNTGGKIVFLDTWDFN